MNSAEGLATALGGVEWYGDTVVLNKSVTLTNTIRIVSPDNPLNLTTRSDASYIISRGMKDGALFELTGVNSNSPGLYLCGNGTHTLTIDGNSSYIGDVTGPLFHLNETAVWDNILKVGAGAILQNNILNASSGTFPGGGAIYVERHCKVEIAGGSIQGNSVINGNGGGICLGEGASGIRFSDGFIENNTADRGGGVYLAQDSGLGMDDGSPDIRDNTASESGGGVYLSPDSYLALLAGRISGNAAPVGGAVDVAAGGRFRIENTGCVDADNAVHLRSGEINLYPPVSSDGGVYNITLPPDNLKIGTNVVSLGEDISIITNSLPLHGSTGSLPMKGANPSPQTIWDIYNAHQFVLAAAYSGFDLYPNGTRYLSVVQRSAPTLTPTPGDGGNTEDSFRILFESQGGSNVQPATGLSYGDLVPRPADPVRDNYALDGWYRETTGVSIWDFASDRVDGDRTLYAKWIPAGSTPTVTPTIVSTAPVPTTVVPTTGLPTPEPTTQVTAEITTSVTEIPDTSGDSGVSWQLFAGGIVVFLLILLLLVLFVFRHTVTFVIPTPGKDNEYKIKVWHRQKIDIDSLPPFILRQAWYLDQERTVQWVFSDDRVTRSILLYPQYR